MFYRFDVYKENNLIGGLFRSANLVLHELSDLSNDDYYLYDRLICKLEYLIDVPPRQFLIVGGISAYKQNGVDEIRDSLKEISEILETYGYCLKETLIEKPKEIVWEDQKQVLLIA